MMGKADLVGMIYNESYTDRDDASYSRIEPKYSIVSQGRIPVPSVAKAAHVILREGGKKCMTWRVLGIYIRASRHVRFPRQSAPCCQ